MALYKQQGSRIWWFEFQLGGQRYRESTKTSSKQLANEAMRTFRRHIEESHNGVRKRQMPKLFPAAAEEYLLSKQTRWAATTMKIQQLAVWHLLPHFRKMLLMDITPADIKKFIEAKQAAGITPRGINMKLQTLRAILRRNHLWERIRPDFKMLRVSDDCGRDLTVWEESQLLAECRASISRVLYPVVVLALCTGMRRSEIRFLQWFQIDLENGIVTIGKSKTAAGESRRPRLNNSALEVMKDWASKFPSREPQHYVFPAEKYNLSADGAPPTIYNQDPTEPIGAWRKAFEAACRRAGIKIRFHDLRHTAATRMIDAGLPIPAVGRCLGWSESTMILMARRYYHLSEEKSKAAFATLELHSRADPGKKKQPKAEKAIKRNSSSRRA